MAEGSDPPVPLGEGSPPSAEFRPVRFRDPHAALGRAVVQLMGHPGFGRLRFGEWARVLVGQINRGDYLFLDRGGRLVAFAGWVRVSEADAETWLGHGGDPGSSGAEGDCLIINAWQAEDAAAQAELLRQMRRVGQTVRRVYGLRSYPDGRLRPVRLAGPAGRGDGTA